MAESPRIEDLRKRYHEHPRRFFAPLANEYRKAGFLDRAVLLCEKHLKEQPDNMNGLVVFGQTLFELGKHEEAKQPFTEALALDPENLIVLRHLGDISRLGNDLAEARRWYEKVLEVDRRNDEVLDILQQMGAGETPDARPSTTSSPLVSVAANVSVSGGDDSHAHGMIEIDASPRPATAAGPGRTKVIDAAAFAATDRGAKPKATGAGSTVVINAQALANADLASAAKAAEKTAAPSAVAHAAPSAAPRPSRRASLLDVSFDFSELPPEPPVAPADPAAPLLGAEAAEYGFVQSGAADPVEALRVDTGPVAAPMGDGGMMAGLETSEISGGDEVSALAGLEPTEFHAAEVAPLEGLVPAEVDGQIVSPLEGLGLASETTVPEPPPAPVITPETAPTLEITAVRPVSAPAPAFDDLPPLEGEPATLPYLAPEPPPPPKPRMTKASMSSLPLIADFGLEEDEPATTPTAAPASTPGHGAPRKPQKTPAFVTETMAALYLEQGYRNEAIEVYRQLIAQDPSDAGMRDKLAALERGEETGLDFEAPAPGATEPAPAPANAVLADVSFAGVGLSTPSPALPPMAMPAAVGPSAREFFAAFARRGAAAAAPAAPPVAAVTPAPTLHAAASPVVERSAHVSASGWPLDAIFAPATDIADLHAAEVVASIGTFEGPSGGTGLDELFAATGPAPRASVIRASETLKFDQFFAAPGAASASGAPTAPASGATPAAAGDDDVNQFQGWLRGLKP